MNPSLELIVVSVKSKKVDAVPLKIPSPSATGVPAYLQNLSDETKDLLKLEMETMGHDWLEVLQGEFKKKYFLDVSLDCIVLTNGAQTLSQDRASFEKGLPTW